MLAACIALGISISSFAYRKQRQDQFQVPIFVLSGAAAIVTGFALGVTANSIMLGLIPWALCTGMVFSVVLHWVVRSFEGRAVIVIHCCELGETAKGGILVRY